MRVVDLVNEGKREIKCNSSVEEYIRIGFNDALDLEVSEEKLRVAGFVKMPREEEIVKMLDGYKSHCEIMSGKLGLFACKGCREDLAKSIITYLGGER